MMLTTTAPREARLSLARELLDDIEGDRLGTRAMLMKASRLADLVGDQKSKRWLAWELGGYDTPAGLAPLAVDLGAKIAAMQRTGRSRSAQPYAIKIEDSLPAIEGKIPSLWANSREIRDKIERGALPEYSRHSADAAASVANNYQQVLERVKQLLHEFAVTTYHRLEFGEIAESIFEKHAHSIEGLLPAEVVEKIPAVYERLAAGDEEAIGHALNTCRRMIWDFANLLAPPGEPVTEEGVKHPMDRASPMNRIEQLLKERCDSATRGERLIKTLRLIHARVSAGIKVDLSADEARSLFLVTYLTLGEIVMATGLANEG